MGNNKNIGMGSNFEQEEYFKIAQRIAGFLTKEGTKEEKQELEEWKNASEENRRLFERIASEKNRENKKRDFYSFHLNMGWEEFRIKRVRAKQWRITRMAMQYAAIVVFIFATGYYFLKSQKVQEVQFAQYTLQPGSMRAHLILANGEMIDLEKHRGTIDLESGSAKVENQQRQLVYEELGKEQELTVGDGEVYNEIKVPRCGEYQLKLSDGTLVYLNSMTNLRFPVQFIGKTREVELSGEAYFKVAKDAEKPFVVKVADQNITVLGTEFNVSAFEDEMYVKTTLVEGAVCVTGKRSERAVALKPNEQLVFNRKDRSVKVTSVDVSYSIAWKDGRFRFRDVRLEEIMQTIQRWYDVEVVYADPETKDYLFGLNFSRNEVIDPILRIFETNGKIKITIMGKKLTIRKGR